MWRPRLLTCALLAAVLLSAAPARGQAPAAYRTAEETPPLPSKKTGDEDPPLPSRKATPVKQPRVQVTAPSAEVQAGDKVIATVKRGQVLPFTRKTDEFYLVTVGGKKGWIKREEVREIDAAAGPAQAQAADVPPGPAPALIAPEVMRKVKQATLYLRVKLEGGNTVEGSGFFAAGPGLVLTNAHVLGMRTAGSPRPTEVSVVVNSGEPDEFTLPAEVLGVDRDNDLGVVRVRAEGRRLPAPLPLGSSRDLTLVQKVYILGFPFGAGLGKDITASESSVSSIRKADGVATQIQVNGGMHPGNSGGPVVDSRGVVVGVAVAMIRGTQINFAVPGERVQELLRGRVAETHFDEAFRDRDQARLPVRLQCVDPLQRIRSVRLEVWPGSASPARPAAEAQPKPLPGDGPRQTLPVNYQNGQARADVALPALAAGQVLWVRPVLTETGGATHWAGAVAYRPSEYPPVERKAAVLQYQFDRQPQRTINLTGSFKTQLFKGPNQFVLQDRLVMQALETAQAEPRGGRFHVFLGAGKITTEVNGKSSLLFPRAQLALRGRNMTYIAGPDGALLQRTVPTLNAPLPLDLRLDFEELVNLISNTYEMTCLVVPGREVQAKETWQARVPLILTSQGKKEIADLLLTCTYLGSRTHLGQKHAVIRLSGTVKAREPGRQSTFGTVTGKVHFAIEDGYLSLAELKVESEGTRDDLTATHVVEVSLTRTAGNTTGLVATPVPPVPPVAGPVTRGRVVLQSVLDLKPGDPQDCPGRPGCFCKARPLNLAAGVTYIVEMDKVGDSRLDPYLVLVDPRGQVVAQDDDSGGNLNARIIYRAPQGGTFRVYATTFGQGMTGTFRLTVSEEAGSAPLNVGGDLERAVPYLQKRDFAHAIPLLEKAVAQNPRLVRAHSDLGFAYNEQRLYDKAIPCFQKVIELDPKHAGAHSNLGHAYIGKGLYDQAIVCLKKAIELDPKHASACNNLGFAYNAQGYYNKGIPRLKKAVELNPQNAIAQHNLALALGDAGRLEPARDALRKTLDLTPPNAPALKAVKGSLAQMEALLALEPQLSDIVNGARKPKDFQEGMQFGRLCRLKEHYTAALRFYDQARAGDPGGGAKDAPMNLLIEARTAVLASAGRGTDPPPEAERPKYRARALTLLRSYVKAQQQALDGNPQANRYVCQQNLRVLAQHRDLASVRRQALDELPADERPQWESFWNDVDSLLRRADAPVPEAAAPSGKG
jgi:S1-C subfamily serine protease/tetratricopeptide (TPR) repeat protein